MDISLEPLVNVHTADRILLPIDQTQQHQAKTIPCADSYTLFPHMQCSAVLLVLLVHILEDVSLGRNGPPESPPCGGSGTS